MLVFYEFIYLYIVALFKVNTVFNLLANESSVTRNVIHRIHKHLFYFQTTSVNVQDFIESRVEKRTKGVYVPIGGNYYILQPYSVSVLDLVR